MLSYMSILVLVLATSTVSPVRAFDPLEIEGTSHSEPSERSRFKITPGKVVAAVGILLVTGIIIGNLVGGPPAPHVNNHNPTNSTQPTQPPAPPPTSPPQPATPPRAFAGREVRILDRRGLTVDTSSGSYSKSYLHDVADSVVTTVGHSEARSISDNDNQKMHASPPDLLKRDHLGEALRLFNRIHDELD